MGKIYTPFSKKELLPKEEYIEVLKNKPSFKIGIPKEENNNEKRVCLSADAVSVLVSNGHKIIIEAGTGLGSNYSDVEYSEAGAQIVSDKKSVFSCPIIMKVNPPTEYEISLINPKTFLFSALQLNKQTKKYFESINNKRITAISFEFLRDKHNELSLLRLISEIAGNASILLASELLSSSNGKGLLLGGITGVRPTEVVILGAGTVGEFATRTAMGLGASVKVFDSSLTRLRRLQYLLGRTSTSILDPKELTKVLKRADVVIAAIREINKNPIWISENMVQAMKKGSVIIDVNIDLQSFIETSKVTDHSNPTFEKHGVIHYGVPNLTSKYARTTSKAISNFFLNYFLHIENQGSIENFILKDQGIKQGIYSFRGKCTNRIIGERFNLTSDDINLLLF